MFTTAVCVLFAVCSMVQNLKYIQFTTKSHKFTNDLSRYRQKETNTFNPAHQMGLRTEAFLLEFPLKYKPGNCITVYAGYESS